MYHLYDYGYLKLLEHRSIIKKLYLYKNGDQLLAQTMDNMFHKFSIIDNLEHEIIEDDNFLSFEMNNSGRSYLISNAGAEHIDYDILDRILKGICIDTMKH
jgi:hypothetical protein